MKNHYQLICLLFAAALGSTMAWAFSPEDLPKERAAPKEGAVSHGGERLAGGSRQGASSQAAPVVDAHHYSYAIGLDIGTSFRQDGISLDFDSLLAGLKDALAGGKPKYDQQTCRRALQQLSKQRIKNMVERNKQYLEENKKAPGVQVTASGLQYKVLHQGTGATPKASDTVRTHYRGTLIDGTEFDSSYARNQPATFPVRGVIPGWTEALQMMHVGDKWQLVIPSKLAYGERGAGDVIRPHSTLIFEIELLGIEAK